MELKAASRRAQIVRMDDQDRVSQASSVATISFFPVMQESDGKVQTFGKRCYAAKRDPNCPVIIRGWLNKKDSSGLKLWKRRWFVLSNYCLYYYKDSREESVLGSIPLPSYKILFCTPRECKNRKFTFKVVHQGMRSYFFSADTQEDMLGWVRALSQSAAMEPDNTMNRRCSSYQDFTQIGGSSESMDFPKSPSEEESLPHKHKHVSRTLSEPSHLSSGRMGRSHSEQRSRRSAHYRNRSPSNRTPSPPDLSRRRSTGPYKEDDSLYVENTPPQAEIAGAGSVTLRGQLGSRPHTPVGRVDIRPHDDPVMVPQTLYYTPASPKLEFKSAPTTPVTERFQSLSKPASIYGSVHHTSSGRKPLGKSHSTGADLLPPLPPSSRATHALHLPQHHHHPHRSHLSASKPDPRELPPIRPLESDADAVLTRLCGCDKLLQSLSVELAQLQMDKDSVQCALEVSRLQVDEWKSQGPRAHEEALTQKAFLQEDLVTIRARMCDVSLEMERVWSQYERMESELSVIRSHLQHICNFGLPQEQSQAQRELWMMEDILDGLKVNRAHFCFLLGLQRQHLFQSPAPHPGSPGSPTERLQMDMEQEPPARPPLPLELQENHQGWDEGHSWTESQYEGIYNHTVEPLHRRGNSQPDLLNVKAHREASESQSGSKSIPPDTANQPTKRMKMKMSEEEQIERMKRNQERMTNKKKPPIPAQGAQSQSSETREEAPFPLRVTRVVTAVLPSSLVARRVSVEDPPAELDTPLPEQIPPEMQLKLAEQRKTLLNKPPRRLLLESPDPNRSSAEMHQDRPVKRTSRQQYQAGSRASKIEAHSEVSRAEGTEASCNQDLTGSGSRRDTFDARAEEQPSAPLTPVMDNDSSLNPEQRDAKLRRVERIRERVMRSAARENVMAANQHPVRGQGTEAHQLSPDTGRKHRIKAGLDGYESCGDNICSSEGLQLSSPTFQDEERQHVNKSKSQAKSENKTQRCGSVKVAKTKTKLPASPSHVSSMTVYQREGEAGFIGCNNEEQKKFEEHTDDDENNFKASDLRAKWFLSTNQWQEFIPLQIPAFETLSNEEKADDDNQPSHSDGITDSNEMSSTVSESLEKMKENHSLFYKIACDISISDSDITKNDIQTSSKPEEEEELLITESLPASNDATPPDQDNKASSQNLPSEENGLTSDKNIQHSTIKNKNNAAFKISANPACVHENTTPQQSDDNSGQESQLTIIESVPGLCVQDNGSDQDLDDCTKTKEKHSGIKESEDKKEDQEGAKELKKCTSLSKENNENKQERDTGHSISLPSSVHEGGGVIRSASFGKPRVTVLRTSL
ncbi:pleckstrin homology domain-containing family A member 5 isoform X2 [Melanotaenia boesemani]|uniref:pleckstrin homology domain-containing family A member 5 isoform X2 n=1 Tax=Melanotaenia boesemani TaxID=1250792 RepID=UPI001C0400BB|nr:pleckstrin homology domain-containing family A member 5 isoform X2 [Melanotaenia boesemani]